MEAEDIAFDDGKNNTPGLARVLTYVAADNVKTFPRVIQKDPNGGGSFADLSTISDKLVVKEGREANQIRVNLKKGSFNSIPVGSGKSMSYRNTLNFFIPGGDDVVRGFAAWVKNRDMVFICKDLDDNRFLGGTPNYPMQYVPEGGINSGDTPEGEREGSFTFEFYAPHPWPRYIPETITVTGNSTGSADDTEFEVDTLDID